MTLLAASATATPDAKAPRAAELTQAAFDLFSTRGIDRVNLDAVASAAGVTKGSLYWHFSSKKDVILAACDLYYERWREQIATATAASPSAYGKLAAGVAYSVRSCLLDEANRVFTTEIVALSLHDAEVRASWAGFLDETERWFLRLCHQAVGRDELVCDDVDRAVDLMLAAMEGIKQTTLFRPQQGAPHQEQRTYARLMSLLGSPIGQHPINP